MSQDYTSSTVDGAAGAEYARWLREGPWDDDERPTWADVYENEYDEEPEEEDDGR
jgi:hypothetical protein